MGSIWIVVADACGVRVFESASPKAKLSRVAQLEQPASRMKVRELYSDRPGRSFSSASNVRHGLAPDEDPRMHGARLLAKELSVLLKREFSRNRFQDLVLVAEPGLLGALKAKLPRILVNRVALSITKDLSHLTDREVAAPLKQFVKDLWSEPRRWDGTGLVA